jgi:hypothetical protein
VRVHHFETIRDPVRKPCIHHPGRMGRRSVGESAANALFDRRPSRL